MTSYPTNIKLILIRALQKHCPQCGQGKIFEKWATLKPLCENCGLSLEKRQGDAWAFMYVSTALVTGLILSVMFFVQPENLYLARGILLLSSMAVLLGSVPSRKSIAIALDYWVELKSNEKHPEEK